MENPDYDEDLYEEKSKRIYKRRSSTSQLDFYREPFSSRTDSDDRSPEQPFGTPRSSHRFSDGQRVGRRASWSEMSRRTDPIRSEVVARSPSYERIELYSDEPVDSEMEGTVEIRKVKKVWSYKTIHGRRDDQSSYGRQDDQSSFGGRDDRSTKASTVRTEDKSKITPAERHVYCPVAKWDVDYTNRNYVRSMCNKPIGLHRHTLGRQFKWDVDNDNTHYLRSQVNAPKGLHRKKKDIKRKRVPDKDVLGDSTGWQFEYGPEFLQAEEDVPFMTGERVIGRGSYRCYGVGRNQSDTDVKYEEKRQKIPGLVEDEFKYGTEFLQDDVQHTLDQKDGTIGRGAYRFYDADRSPCDKKPCDMMGIDYRESRTRIEQSDESEEDKEEPKGKPFKRTVLKKTVKLMRRPSDGKLFEGERCKYGTHLKFVPGMGSRTTYEGTPTQELDRKPDMQVKRHPSIRSVFKKKSKTCSYSQEGFHCEKKYSHKHFWDEKEKKPDRSYGTFDRCDICDGKGRTVKEKKPDQRYGTFDRCELCERKETTGKMRKTPEGKSYSREITKKGTRPPAQSYTSYESCNLCERREVPGMQKKFDRSDDTCIICEKKKIPGKQKKTLDTSDDTCIICEKKKAPRKFQPKERSERSYASFDSCDLCEKKEEPRVATPKKTKESKSMKRSPTRESYAKKPSSSHHSYDRRYGQTENYEKKKKASPREYRTSEGNLFRKWKEMEDRETCPLRMSGSISQRKPRYSRQEPKTRDNYQRFQSPYACPAEMMDDEDEEDEEEEEMLDHIPPCIENRMKEIKKRMSETRIPRENGKGYPKRLSGSSSQNRAIQIPKEPKFKECLGRYQDQCIYSGQVMNDDRDMSSEEFVPHVESSIQLVKKTASRTSFPAQKKKISPKRINGSVSRKLPTDARKESKHKKFFKNYRDKDNYSRGLKENGKIVEKFPSHSGSRVQTLAKKASPTKLPDAKRKSLKEYREEDEDEFSDSDEIDFEEHKNHPKDHAKSFKDGYEKYVNKNGSEIWIKAEEKYSELHHIP